MPVVAATEVKIAVPGNHLMVGLLGQRDELLRLVEAAFPDASIIVRGNEISVAGEGAELAGRTLRGARAAARGAASGSTPPPSGGPSTW